MRGNVFWPVQLLRKQLSHSSRNVAFAQGNHANGIDNLGRIAFLVKVAASALTNQVHRVMFFRIAAQDQDADIGRLRTDHGECINSALTRHGQVHDENIQFNIANQINRLTPTCRFTDNAQIHLIRKKLLQSRPHNGMVIHNSNFYHVAIFL